MEWGRRWKAKYLLESKVDGEGSWLIEVRADQRRFEWGGKARVVNSLSRTVQGF